MKVLVIGLDSAVPDLVFHRWRDQLPHLKALMERGARGPRGVATIIRVNREDSVRVHGQSGTFAPDTDISLQLSVEQVQELEALPCPVIQKSLDGVTGLVYHTPQCFGSNTALSGVFVLPTVGKEKSDAGFHR